MQNGSPVIVHSWIKLSEKLRCYPPFRSCDFEPRNTVLQQQNYSCEHHNLCTLGIIAPTNSRLPRHRLISKCSCCVWDSRSETVQVLVLSWRWTCVGPLQIVYYSVPFTLWSLWQNQMLHTRWSQLDVSKLMLVKSVRVRCGHKTWFSRNEKYT